MSNSTENFVTGAENIRWDLSDLYISINDPQLTKDMQTTRDMADVLVKKYKGQIVLLSAEDLLKLLQDYEVLETLLMKINCFCVISYTVNRENAELGRLDAMNDAHQAEVRQKVAFFKLEWVNLPETPAQALLDNPVLAHYRHYLEVLRLEKPYMLSEAEENIIRQLSLSSSWPRYFEDWTARLRYLFEGKELTEGEFYALGDTTYRTLRKRLDEVMLSVQKQHHYTPTYIYNMFLLDKFTKDKLRGYPGWLSEYNLANQLEDKAVDTLLHAVSGRFDMVYRYYRLKKKLLGYDDFYSYDISSPLEIAEKRVSWQEAKNMVLEGFSLFDQRFAVIAKHFFDNSWIDAPPAVGKDYMAYCTSATSSVHPYIFMNYQGTLENVTTLAHELGHGIHNYLAKKRGQLNYETPNALSEVASTFCNLQFYKYLLQKERNPLVRRSLQMKQLQTTLLSVHVCVARTMFESSLHNTYREKGELSTEQITELYTKAMQALYGEDVTLTESFRQGWLFNTFYTSFPGYQYSYAFAELVVWSLVSHYEANPDNFADQYIALLKAGGSNYPHKLLEPLGVDLNDENFWKRGLELIDKMLVQLEGESGLLR